MTNSVRVVGYSAAMGMVIVGLLYAATLAAGIVRAGFDEPIRGSILTAMEALTLVSAPLIVLLFAAVLASSHSEAQVYGLAAFGFAVAAAGLTAAVHFVGLTALRQRGEQGIEWPSQLYAVELLSWDFFLGLALVFAAPVFNSEGDDRVLRNALLLTGGLCLAGTVGPLLGNMRLQFLGVTGYGLVLPMTCFLLARHFRSAGGVRHGPNRPVV